MLDMTLGPTFPDTPFVADKLALSRSRHSSWLTDPTRVRERKGLRDERGKIGDDALKVTSGGYVVYSEILELEHIATSRRFLISYQSAKLSERETVSAFVLDGLTSYIQATTPKPAVPGGAKP